ncbi:MAG: DNA internalization-related competence protein ComEC/Rec2 [Candidatus Cloacimonadaceae bacterium]|nr:DNA internalization-related competence protein ComEC/Rec2 [Candidatus Cloacimonadota bacterium]
MPQGQIKKPLPAPLLWPVIAWIAGIVLVKRFYLPWQILAVCSLSLLLLAIFCRKGRTPVILLLFLILGALRFESTKLGNSPLAEALAEKGTMRQELSFRVIRRLSERSYAVQLEAIAGHPAKDKLLLYAEGVEYTPGAKYHTVADLQVFSQDPILDVYPNRYVGSIRSILPAQLDLAPQGISLGAKAALWIRQRLQPLPEEQAQLAAALLLSDASFKSARQSLLSRAGISHLVVVSGLHVLVIYFILITILRFFLPHRFADLIFLILICAFAALNNWAAPITRAILMISLVILAKWLSRPLSSVQNLSLSLFIITLYNPAELFSLGLILSFASVSIIIAVVPKIRLGVRSSGITRYGADILNYMLLSLIVGIGLMPITLYYFGTLSLNSVIGNLLGLPLMAVLLGLSLTILVLPFEAFYNSYSFVARLWDAWLRFSSALPFQIQNHWVSTQQSIALALLIIVLALLIRRQWKLLSSLGMGLLIVAGLLYFVPHAQRNRLMVFNAGTADCSLILTQDGSRIMIDSGGVSSQRAETSLLAGDSLHTDSWAGKKLIRSLKQAHIHKLDYLVITHLHSDHAAGLPALCRQLEIKNLLLSRSAVQSKLWQDLAAKLELANTRIYTVDDTLSLHFGNQRLKILHPVAQYPISSENNASIVCRFDDTVHRYLFCADIETEAENWLLHHYPEELRADYLKVPHHGSRNSSSLDFLQSVNPREAWISCARTNVHGFPHPETLQRFNQLNIPLLFTYEGSIIRQMAQKD